MNTKVGEIYYQVDLDTSRLIRGQRDVDRSTKAAAGSLDRVGASAKSAGSQLDRAAGSFNTITRAVKLYAAALALVQAAKMADDLRLLQARVNVAADGIEAGAVAMDRLRDISTRTRSALADNVQIFARLNPSIRQMGGDAGDTLRVVELLSKAITVSGASAAEKSASMIQFAQAMGSGKLAGDELRSLLENAPYLMQQLADGLGVPIGALKNLGEQGKLTSDVVVNALGKAADKINKDFATFPQTLAASTTVALDSLRRLVAAIDEVSGSSTAMAGVVKGVGTFFEKLAEHINRVSNETDDLNRNNAVEQWAERATTALSYVADAVDFVQRGFLQTGSAVGAALAVVTAPVSQIKGILTAAKDDILRIGSQPYAGKSIRDGMAADKLPSRGAMDAATRRGNARDASSTLTSPVAASQGDAAKYAAKRAAAQAYYEGLLADARTGLAKIDAEERKALEENAKRQAQDPKNADIYGKARLAIAAKYGRERSLLEESYTKETAAMNIAITEDEAAKIEKVRAEAYRAADAEVRLGVKTFEQGEQLKTLAAFESSARLQDLAERDASARVAGQLAAVRDTEERIRIVRDESVRLAEAGYIRGRLTFEEAEAAKVAAAAKAEADTRALRDSREQTKLNTLSLRAGSGGIEDQAALIRAQAAAQMEASLEAQAADLANAQLYADQRVAIEAEMTRRIDEMRSASIQTALTATANSFDALVQATESGTGKQDAVYRAAFLAQKAFSIASAIVAIQTGVANAAALPFPANLGAMASVVAATASIISTIKSVSYGGGREKGGPVSAGSMYRVNEGGRPEMFTAANGNQYMLPTKSGRVTSADDLASGAGGASGRGGTVQNITQNFHVPQGTSMQTQQQIAAAASRGLQAAAARNN